MESLVETPVPGTPASHTHGQCNQITDNPIQPHLYIHKAIFSVYVPQLSGWILFAPQKETCHILTL